MKLEKLQQAFQQVYSIETCYPSDRKLWSEHKPGTGHCAMDALTVHYFCGGDILEKKHKSGRAFYNRLPNGQIIDLSGQDCDKIDAPVRIRDPKSLLRGHTKDRFLLFLSRVQPLLDEVLD